MDSFELAKILNDEVQKKVKDENIIARNQTFINILDIPKVGVYVYKFEYDSKTTDIMGLFMPDFLKYADEFIVPKIKEYRDNNKNCQYQIYAKYISADMNQTADKNVFLISLYIGKVEN